jgi:hypothetical protein
MKRAVKTKQYPITMAELKLKVKGLEGQIDVMRQAAKDSQIRNRKIFFARVEAIEDRYAELYRDRNPRLALLEDIGERIHLTELASDRLRLESFRVGLQHDELRRSCRRLIRAITKKPKK